MNTLAEVPGLEDLSSAELAVLEKLPEQDLRDYSALEATDPAGARKAIQALAEAEADAEVQPWTVFMKIVNVFVTIAGVVSPIAGAATAVLGTVAAAKGLSTPAPVVV
jgi:hypothetical protein